MMRLLLAFSACLILMRPAMAAEDDLSLHVEIETASPTPFVQEMVRLVIKGAYKIPITLEHLEQPDLDGFGWMQLGEDKWFESTERGRRVVNLERRMSLFPERAGTLVIEPFEHRLTLSRPNGERYERVVRSEPVTVEVAPHPDVEAAWFPLTRISVNDSWSNAPQALERDQSALRGVALTAEGVQPEMIPAMPEMTGAGVSILPHPEKRITVLRPRGPVTRVFWRWTIRPDGNFTGYVDPLDIHYFDATAREPRTITLSAQRVAFVDASGIAANATAATGDSPATARRSSDWRGFDAAGIVLALICGVLAGVGTMFRGKNGNRGALVLRRDGPEGSVRALNRALRRGDDAALRHAAAELVRADLRGRLYDDDTALADHIRGFDRQLYGPGAIPPDRRAFARAFKSARRKAIREAASGAPLVA